MISWDVSKISVDSSSMYAPLGNQVASYLKTEYVVYSTI